MLLEYSLAESLTLWMEGCEKPKQHIQKQTQTQIIADKGLYVESHRYPSGRVRM